MIKIIIQVPEGTVGAGVGIITGVGGLVSATANISTGKGSVPISKFKIDVFVGYHTLFFRLFNLLISL